MLVGTLTIWVGSLTPARSSPVCGSSTTFSAALSAAFSAAFSVVGIAAVRGPGVRRVTAGSELLLSSTMRTLSQVGCPRQQHIGMSRGYPQAANRALPSATRDATVDRVTRATDAVGAYGERVAVRALEAAGMRVLDRNWRCRRGELDIVALDGRTIVFCEVKTRRTASFGAPAEAVGPAKVRRLRALAAAWLAENPQV